MRVWAPENLTSAFRKSGIYPVNKDMTADSDTAPSLVYNQHDDFHPSSSHPHTASSTEPHWPNEEAKDSKNSNNSIFVLSAEQPFQFCQRMNGQKQVMATALRHCRWRKVLYVPWLEAKRASKLYKCCICEVRQMCFLWPLDPSTVFLFEYWGGDTFLQCRCPHCDNKWEKWIKFSHLQQLFSIFRL